MLSINIEAVDHRLVLRIIAGAVAVSALLALATALILLGSRTDV